MRTRLPTCTVLLLVGVAAWAGEEAESSDGEAFNQDVAERSSCRVLPEGGRTRKRSPLDAAPVGGLPAVLPHGLSSVEHHGPKAAEAAGVVSTHSAVISHGIERVVAHGPSAPLVVPVPLLHVLTKVTKTSLTVDHGGPSSVPRASHVTVVTGLVHHVVVAPVVHENMFHSHLGGHGEGLGFGGHGSGHGFFV
ncbi:uncharacterized protein LOC134534483 [Bacillus rossius redtenbacheri]|uniref:uncharacterized protein LOC134534483 n=1 Tax=Bacillus rossius redtenbacheri TaxID=93214 RepID=UPI002FDDADDD